jgi:hypothetical protein
MPSINDYLKYGETALAAYASKLMGNVNVVKSLNDAGIPTAEATKFAAAWCVIAQFPKTIDGFSTLLPKNRTRASKTDLINAAPTGRGSIPRFALCALIAVAMSGCGSKYAADKEIQALCAKDGGIKVYEQVALSASDYNEYGEPLGRYIAGNPPEDWLGPDYKYEMLNSFVKRGDTLKGEIEISKFVSRVFRKRDGKLLGESISYSRKGGDLLVLLLLGGHPSSSSCPEGQGSLVQTIFVRRD